MIKLNHEQLSKVLTIHEEGKLKYLNPSLIYNQSEQGYHPTHKGCLAQVAIDEEQSFDGHNLSQWFDNNYRSDWSSNEFLSAMELVGIA